MVVCEYNACDKEAVMRMYGKNVCRNCSYDYRIVVMKKAVRLIDILLDYSILAGARERGELDLVNDTARMFLVSERCCVVDEDVVKLLEEAHESFRERIEVEILKNNLSTGHEMMIDDATISGLLDTSEKFIGAMCDKLDRFDSRLKHLERVLMELKESIANVAYEAEEAHKRIDCLEKQLTARNKRGKWCHII